MTAGWSCWRSAASSPSISPACAAGLIPIRVGERTGYIDSTGTLRAGAIYERKYLLGTSMARPILAKRQVEIALREGADAVAHGCTGKGNDQVRFELTAACLAPELQVVVPWRDGRFRDQFPGRAEMIAYCEQKKIPVQASAKKPYSMDRNLLHISYEAGILEDPWMDMFSPKNKDMFKLSVAPEDAPNKAEYVTLDFAKGNCVAVNGQKLSPLGVMKALNKLGGKHGVGRVDMVENRYVGMKSRGVYETPGGTVLTIAHRALETLTLDREVMHLRDSLIPRYAEMVYYGYWFAPEREMLQAAIDEAARVVTGTARLRLYRGSVRIVGRKAPRSLYDPKLVSFDAAGGYRQEDASGFIRLAGLRLRLRALAHRGRPSGGE